MSLENCRECGRLYNRLSRDYCNDCYNKMEDDFEIVKEYIYEEGPQPAYVISQQTGIKESWINKWTREGRLFELGMEYPCGRCGKLIKQGKMCKQCTEEFQREVDISLARSKFRGPQVYTKDLSKK